MIFDYLFYNVYFSKKKIIQNSSQLTAVTLNQIFRRTTPKTLFYIHKVVQFYTVCECLELYFLWVLELFSHETTDFIKNNNNDLYDQIFYYIIYVFLQT